MKNKFTTYLLYAVGEIFLVVIGILIAVQIDHYNGQLAQKEQEIDSYRNIVSDLKKDSIHFIQIMELGRIHQITNYHIYHEILGEKSYEDTILYDFIFYTMTFNPITKNNHQVTIDKLQDEEVRNNLNEYFNFQFRSQDALDDFNKSVREIIRPYAERNKLLNYNNVFHPNMFDFFPDRGSLINYDQLKVLMKDSELLSLIARSRLSTGYFIYELGFLQEENANLIKNLQSKIAE